MPTTCTTSDTAFLDYGIESGHTLVPATYYHLAERGDRTVEPTLEYFHRVADAFRTVYVRRADVPVVPDPVEAAIEDALTATLHEFGGDDADPNLRTDLLPAFYARVAGYACVYRQWYTDGGVGVEFD